MQFQSNVKVLGMKASKGQLENGNKYDSTKVYVETPLDETKGTAKGFASAEYNMGDSSEFEKFKHLPFPLECVATLELVTTGKVQSTRLVSIKPISMANQATQPPKA